MRGYFYGNFYLSSVQQGIQALHCLGEMHNTYDPTINERVVYLAPEYVMLREWERNHKTVILCSGGNCNDLMYIQENLAPSAKGRYPCATFYEDSISLNSAITCTGIILPEKIYNAMEEMREGLFNSVTSQLDPTDMAIAGLLYNYPLAR